MWSARYLSQTLFASTSRDAFRRIFRPIFLGGHVCADVVREELLGELATCATWRRIPYPSELGNAASCLSLLTRYPTLSRRGWNFKHVSWTRGGISLNRHRNNLFPDCQRSTYHTATWTRTGLTLCFCHCEREEPRQRHSSSQHDQISYSFLAFFFEASSPGVQHFMQCDFRFKLTDIPGVQCAELPSWPTTRNWLCHKNGFANGCGFGETCWWEGRTFCSRFSNWILYWIQWLPRKGPYNTCSVEGPRVGRDISVPFFYQISPHLYSGSQWWGKLLERYC